MPGEMRNSNRILIRKLKGRSQLGDKVMDGYKVTTIWGSLSL
jgi:hypothetical protein